VILPPGPLADYEQTEATPWDAEGAIESPVMCSGGRNSRSRKGLYRFSTSRRVWLESSPVRSFSSRRTSRCQRASLFPSLPNTVPIDAAISTFLNSDIPRAAC
jgi:hypothetical protein